MTGGGLEYALVSLLMPRSFVAEQYRALRHIIEDTHRSSNLSIIAVSSPSVGDGKTTTTINLAGALAQTREIRVLLVDGDLRRPSVTGRLGLKKSVTPGLVGAILDETLTLDDIVKPLPDFNLSVLPAGHGSELPYEALKSPRVGKLFDEARSRYDYVLVDTPPLVPMADCRIISKWVDGFVIVVTAHKTPRPLVEEAFKVIETDKILGLVFNCDDRVNPGYYYGYSSYYHTDDATWVTRWRRHTDRVAAALRHGARRAQQLVTKRHRNGREPDEDES
jgi:capsular exopolysaccharide synthesis family protein